MTTPAIRLTGVTVRRTSGRGPVDVVTGLDLTVDVGEFVVLMGPSGSGKTTVLQVAAGLLAPAAGTVELAGHSMPAGASTAWATARRRHLGMVHQRLDLLDGLGVLDNVALPLLLDGTSVRAAQHAARAALERLGIAGLGDAQPAELSVGEQQLVAVARAVVGDRRVVLADEPTAALDTVSAERVVGVLADLAQSGLAVLMATHDARMASWADRIEHLRDGALVGAAPKSTETILVEGSNR